MHSITKEVYKKEKDIPDWANLKYNKISAEKWNLMLLRVRAIYAHIWNVTVLIRLYFFL